jgi:glucose-1-phosphate cytidylyltransferase
MKTVILAGGLGTRISEETVDKPKPMVLVDDKPIIWHVMDIYARQGFSEFVIATGYKSEVIEHWVQGNDIYDLNSAVMKIKTVNTGLDTQTGGRISGVMKILPKERVIATYGDGLANVSINKLIKFSNKKRLKKFP